MARDRHSAMQSLSALLPKLDDPDPDIRFMQLNDLAALLNLPTSEYLRTDAHSSVRVIEKLIKALTDQNGEVQNQALKCIGPLVIRLPSEMFAPYLDKVAELTLQDIDLSIPLTALRTLVVALPHPPVAGNEKDVREAYAGVSRVLIPKLVGGPISHTDRRSTLSPGLLQQQKNKSYSTDAVDVATEVVRFYGTVLHEQELRALGNAVLEIIKHPQASGVVKKRALVAIGVLVSNYKDAQLDAFVAAVVEELQNQQIDTIHRRYLISTIGVLARSIPNRIGTHLDNLAPFVLKALSQEELDATHEEMGDDTELDPDHEELREAALAALEALMASCPNQMKAHWDNALAAALRYVKYDPNVVDMEDEEMSGTRDLGSDDGFTEDAPDEDDEYAELDDDDFGDVEDMSWKVRRSAAKVLHAIVLSSGHAEHKALFGRVIPVLISCLNSEREDSVRLEVIATTAALVRKTGAMPSNLDETATSTGKEKAASTGGGHKRKRQDSEASTYGPELRGLVQTRASPPFEPAPPPSGSQADLAMVLPKLVQAVRKMWKKGSTALKQAAVVMLKAIAQARNGSLADHLQQLEDALADALKFHHSGGSSTASVSTATTASLQIEALTLISVIAETNGSTVLIPFVIALIPPVVSLTKNRNYKVSTETLNTIEQFAKALTPPRLSVANQDHAIHLERLYEVVSGPVNDVNADLEVRHRALHVFGVLLARTSSTTLLASDARVKGLGVLNDRLKNETTRLESARAIGLVASAVSLTDNIGAGWINDVSNELAQQLRKADRMLRASCLEALQFLALNPATASQLETATIQTLQNQLLPMISTEDLQLLTPALVVLAKIIPTNSAALVTSDLVTSLCVITQARLEGPPLKAHLLVVKVIGECGGGPTLMKGLLSVGTDGDTLVLGRAIGTLMVAGGAGVGVTIDDFMKEIRSQSHAAACLALTVMGEIGLRTGSSSTVDMKIFVKNLSSSSDKVRLAAAMALGSASSSDIPQHLPVILDSLGSRQGQDYLYLQALKEVLQSCESRPGDIASYASQLWQKLFAVSASEDTRAIGAECLGRLVMTDPTTYMAELSRSVDDSSVVVRGIVISAFRFTLSTSGSAYQAVLSTAMVPFLKRILGDPDLGNRRLAVTTLTAAIQHKPDLILVHINQLLPTVLQDTYIKPELIKTIKIGPFTHQEDSGVDLRKSAYGVLYALIDTPQAIPSSSVLTIFDRIQDGVPDDGDIRTMCTLMLNRLSNVYPEETRRRLPTMAERMKKVLEIKPKENAVKQEIEKINEANSAVIRASLELDRKFPDAAQSTEVEMTPWRQYFEYMRKEFPIILKNVSNEG